MIQQKKGNIDARNKLLEHNIRLVIYIVMNNFKDLNYDKEELVSIGNNGLLKAINTFDNTKKTKFASYATVCIINEIRMFIRKLNKDTVLDSIDRRIDEDEKISLGDTLPSKTNIEDDYLKDELINEINKLIEGLPLREKNIMKMFFGFNNGKRYTQKEIAEELKLSQSYISRIIKKQVKIIGVKLSYKGLIELKQKEGNNMAKELMPLYSLFKNYSEEEVNTMLEKLTSEEKELIRLRYGNDLKNPVTSAEWTAEHNKKFYGSLLVKMKRLLSNPNKTYRARSKKDNEFLQDSNKIIRSNEERIINTPNDISIKEVYIKIQELFKTQYFDAKLKAYTPKEITIIALNFGYINNKSFTTSEIASFLGVETQEVIDIIKKVLLEYKDMVNQFIDNMIDTVEIDRNPKRKK